MSYYTLNLQVEGGDISASHSVVTADSVEYITAAFTFDESWSDLLKTAIFRVSDVVYHIPLENDSCKIPFEALKEPMMYISVFGISGLVRATTSELPIQVQNSGYTVCEPKAPTPDPYNYFLEKVNDLKNEAAAEAEKSLSNAESTSSHLNEANEVLKKVIAIEENANAINNEISNSVTYYYEALDEIYNKAEYVTEMSEQAAVSAKAAQEAESATMDKIEVHNSEENLLAHPNIIAIANQAKSIALGKANSICFDTETQLKEWVTGKYSRTDGITAADLKIGDNLYILELGVPDYWWDGKTIQPLGAEKPDFSDYYQKSEIDARISDISFDCVSQREYDSLYLNNSLDAGKIYFVYEED